MSNLTKKQLVKELEAIKGTDKKLRLNIKLKWDGKKEYYIQDYNTVFGLCENTLFGKNYNIHKITDKYIKIYNFDLLENMIKTNIPLSIVELIKE